MHLVRLMAATGISILAVGCSGYGTGPDGGAALPRQVTVRATDANVFSPTAVTLASGGRVTFTFEATAHSVRFQQVPGAPADITGDNSNTSVQRTFDDVGTFDFDCPIHAGMTGRIVVSEPGDPNYP